MVDHLSKKTIRSEMLQKRRCLSPQAVEAASASVCERLSGSDLLGDSSVMAGYVACDNEVDLHTFYTQWLGSGKKLYFPRYDQAQGYVLSQVYDLAQDLVPGKYDIPEPKPDAPTLSIEQAASAIDVWLVPGVAFDNHHHRLGRGRGIYDRFLAQATGIKIGIGHSFQCCDRLPTDAHDVKMDQVFLG